MKHFESCFVCSDSFDYETQSEYVFSLIVTDNGRTPRQSSPSTVTIAITNLNDESPEFDPPGYSKQTFSENLEIFHAIVCCRFHCG